MGIYLESYEHCHSLIDSYSFETNLYEGTFFINTENKNLEFISISYKNTLNDEEKTMDERLEIAKSYFPSHMEGKGFEYSRYTEGETSTWFYFEKKYNGIPTANSIVISIKKNVSLSLIRFMEGCSEDFNNIDMPSFFMRMT